MRMRDTTRSGGGGSGSSKGMSTLDYLVTKVKRHVRASSADSTTTSSASPIVVEEEVELRVSEDEGGGGGGGLEEEEASRAAHLRPPSFNPEDYAQALAKYSKTPHVYLEHTPKEKKGRGDRGRGGVGGETRGEMSLRQFSSLPELLRRLRDDLKMAYLSFVKELVREPHDGVSLLLDVLKSIQLSQTDLTGRGTSHAQQMALRRALADEHEVLCCLRYCLRSPDAPVRVARYPPGLYTLAVATLSNLPRSRTIALELLTRACLAPGGRGRVVEALATLRLRFAEPVTCKFLVAMMVSHPHPSLQAWGLRLVNALVMSSETVREKVYLQEELTLAGLHPPTLRKVIERAGGEGGWKDAAMKELDVWEANYLDVGQLHGQVEGLKQANDTLHDELAKLRQANMKLLEENVLLKTVGGEVQERCAILQRQLSQSGLPIPQSPCPSLTDSDLSSLATVRSRRHRNSSPTRSSRSCETETDSVIFRPVRPHEDVSSSDDTVIPSRPPSATSSSLLLPNTGLAPQISRSRHHSSPSSTLDFSQPAFSPPPLSSFSPTSSSLSPAPSSFSPPPSSSFSGEVRVVEERGGEGRRSRSESRNSDNRGREVKENDGWGKENRENEGNNREKNGRGSENNMEIEQRGNETLIIKNVGREIVNTENKENETHIEIRGNGVETRGTEIKIVEVKPKTNDRFNEFRPPPLIDLTLRNEVRSPSGQPTQQSSSRSDDQPPRPPHRSSSRQRQQVSELPPDLQALPPTPPTPHSVTPPPGENKREVNREGERTSQVSSTNKSSSPLPSTSPPSSSSPSNKRRTPPVASPLSSSTSSLSSSSPPSSPEAGQRMDPEYMNVPRRTDKQDNETRNSDSRSSNESKKGSERGHSEMRNNSDTRGSNETRVSSEDTELDYEQDVGVYEAVTVAGDRIFIQSTDTQSSGGSASSHKSKEGRKEKGESKEKRRENGESKISKEKKNIESKMNQRKENGESKRSQEIKKEKGESRVSQEVRKGENKGSQENKKENVETQTQGGKKDKAETTRASQEIARRKEELLRLSQENQKVTEGSSSGGKQENVVPESSVKESVRHYENLAMMADKQNREPRSENRVDGKDERSEKRSEDGSESRRIDGSDDVTEKEVEAVMNGLENVLRSAESSLSLTSQETVKENGTLPRDHFEDRSSPGAITGEELEIVPTRVPHPPARSHSHASPVTSPRDPVLFLELESPAETSDTETLHNPRPGSPHTIETESTRSFGFIQPDVSLRRRETMTERGGGSGERKRQQLRRCESFQAAGSECEYEYDSHRSYSPRHRSTTEQHVPMRETAMHISGRVFTRYTPQEVERRNRVNNLITAELARRKNRSVEDHLDQWHGGPEEDWTLRWRYPEVHPDSHQPRPNRTRSRTRSPSRDPPRRSKSSSRHPSSSAPPVPPHKPSRGSKFSNSELIAFTGFRNPNGGGFRESDYGPNFMLNTPPRIPDFADYGGRDFPPQHPLPLPPHRSSRERGVGRRKQDFDPDIPTPDYTATPAGTLTAPPNGAPSKHILELPSGLY